jgi:hypothetical protein
VASDRFIAGGLLPGALANPRLQEELKLTDAQKESLREYSEKLREELRQRFGRREDGEDLSEQQRRERFRKMREQVRAGAAEVETKVSEILEPAQFKRFKQIELQLQGVQGLGRADVAQPLGLSDQQKQDLRQVIEEMRRKSAELRERSMRLFQGYRDLSRDLSDEQRQTRRQQGEQLREEREKIRKDAQKQAMAILTDEQRTKLSDLKGEPFEFGRSEGLPGDFGGRPRGEARRGKGRGGRQPEQ